MAGKIQLQKSLQKPYERRVFAGEVLTTIFQNRVKILASPINETAALTTGEASLMKQVLQYGKIILDDGTNVICYEITLHDNIRLEQNKISIQQYVRKLMVSGEAMLISFIQTNSTHFWRLSLVSSDTALTDSGEIKDLKTNAKRYTYLLGESETCLTAAAQMVILEGKANINKKDLVDAFSVEKVSKPFFEEYTKIHYKRFNDYLIASNFRASVFNGDEKAIRDFVKKLLGRIVFLYFVQKKGWLGSPPTDPSDCPEGGVSESSFSPPLGAGGLFWNGDRNFISNLFKKSGGDATFYPVWLSKLFFDTLNASRPHDAFTMPDKSTVRIPFLNGGLFEKDKHDNSLITFPPAMFHNAQNHETDKERGFLDFLDAYNFTVYEDSPDDHTVAVDPEMLGHIFENLLEDNKDKGAFYTPKEIVHYMCQESLVEYLAPPAPEGGAIPRTDIEDLIKNNKVNEGLQKHLKTIDKYLDDVRICDPAIGSGAFPMGLLHEIFNAKMLLHVAIHKAVPTPTQRVEMKLHIIQNSIYGVDIERGAVDIAQLRFWLSLIVDEQSPKALPNLDYKIVVGNSLVSKFEDDVISIDWEVKEGTQTDIFGGNVMAEKRVDLLKKISKKQHEYFLPENHDKKLIAGEIRNLKIDLLINQLELMVKNTKLSDEPKSVNFKTKALFVKAQEDFLQMVGWQKTISKLKTLKDHPQRPFNHFDWKLDFPEILNPALVGDKTGFDIVIGNPPYFNVQTLGAKSVFIEQIKKNYAEIWMDKSDILFYFIKQGIDLAKTHGNVSYIISNAFLFSEKAQRLRNYILQYAPIQRIVNFEQYMVFDSAMITTAIVQFGKSKTNTTAKALNLREDNKQRFELAIQNRNNFTEVSLKPDNVFALVNTETQTLNDKIDKGKTLLGSLFLVGSGMQTAANEVFSGDGLIDKNFPNEFMKKRLNGKAIKRYMIDTNFTDNMLYIDHVDSFEILPKNIQQYLSENSEILNNRATVKNEGRAWWRYSRPMHKEYYHLNKIWTSYRSASNCFAFDETKDYIGLTNTTVIFDTNSSNISLKYILALVNSQLLNYRYKSIGKQTGGGIFEYFENGISKLPIPEISLEAQKPFIAIVDKILAGKKTGGTNFPKVQNFREVGVADNFREVGAEKVGAESTAALEAEIDRLVYELYGLSAAEIAVVEGRELPESFELSGS